MLRGDSVDRSSDGPSIVTVVAQKMVLEYSLVQAAYGIGSVPNCSEETILQLFGLEVGFENTLGQAAIRSRTWEGSF